MVNLGLMTDEDFAAFMRKSVPEYAYDQMRAGNWTAIEAVGKARSEFQQMLPDGPKTPNAYLHSIIDEEGTLVGMLWYYVDPSRTRKTAFLIDFFIFPERRNKGYESQALQLFEDEARGLGIERVELQVFSHRKEDVEFYRENDFTETSVLFAKDLSNKEKP